MVLCVYVGGRVKKKSIYAWFPDNNIEVDRPGIRRSLEVRRSIVVLSVVRSGQRKYGMVSWFLFSPIRRLGKLVS